MDNRANILHQALKLFATRGYDAVGVQEICDTAEITKPTLYHYFGSKRGLMEALVNEGCAVFMTELASTIAYSGDLPLNLQKVVSAFFGFATREPTLYRLLLALWFSPPSNEAFGVVAALHEKQEKMVVEMFARASDDHGNMRGRERAYAATFIGMINTYIGLALNNYLELKEAIIYQAVKQFSYGIYS
ncbi:MAG: TetR/AcrR family transcriptional regulator [Chloroflexota bacterium]|jgi:TetR/AcrR family transcriptional regulator